MEIAMSDPRMSEPRDYQRPDFDRTHPNDRSANAVWGWVAAAVFVAAVLLFVFASGSNDSAQNGVTLPPTASAPPVPPVNPSTTTGAAPTTRTPAPTTAPTGGTNQ
jgi:hypothetical protein